MVLTIQLLPWAQLPSYLVLSVVALCTFVVDGWEERRDLALVNGVLGTSVGSTLSMSLRQLGFPVSVLCTRWCCHGLPLLFNFCKL